ncbi:MAG: ATP-binding cassette domain-containing protein, partial [Chloroflexota bacterium]
PHILVFDEPTANLDPVGTQDVFALIGEQKAQHDHTIILIEHKLDELMHLIDRVVVLGEHGSILADGTPRTVFGDYADTLKTHGIWMPQVCLLAHHLRTLGFALEPFPVTLEEAETALQTIEVSSTLEQVSNPQETITTSLPEATTVINVHSLSFNYGQKRILDDVSLTIPQGDFLAIVGSNGAGKTTLAQHLVHILSPPAKTIFINNNDLTRIQAHDLMTQIGYVFQNPEHQFITNSVYDEIAYGLRTMGLGDDEVNTHTTTMLERFGLTRYAKANPFTLSHGEKRRLSVATMLAVGQEILILDEPTFGQDQRNATAMMELLQDLHGEGRTIIIISHDMGLVADYAQHVAVMSQGHLLFHGPTSLAFAQPDLLQQARLTLPPLARLTAQMAEHHSAWQGLLTMDDIIEMFDQTMIKVSQ